MRSQSTFVALVILATVGSACVTVTQGSPSSSATPAESTAPASESPSPTGEPTATADETPTSDPSESASADQLNFSLDPNFGETDLTAGFTPDPYTVSVTSGGPIDASYLSGCNGWATGAPDYKLTYTAGSASLLRFYFIPESTGDTTLIINDPAAAWACEDDSYDGLNPSVDFDDPAGGRYDIWIGSYSSDAQVAGTLYVTELDSNHP